MKYALVALDIDGTLLNSQGELSPGVRSTIKAVVEKGVIVTLATGRRMSSTLPWARALDIDVPIVVHNGAVVVNPITKNISLQKGIPVSVANQIHEDLLKRNIPHLVYKGEDHGDTGYLLSEFGNENKALFLEYIDDHIQFVDSVEVNEAVIKISAIGKSQLILANLDDLSQSYGTHTNMTVYQSPTYSGVDFAHSSCSKASGINHIITELGLSFDDVIAIGDQANDLEMIKSAGLGVAMYNAPQHVKEAAAYITSSNDQDGVAQVLEEYFL